MKPIYAVIYQECYELHLVGAYEDYQDAYNAMVQDVKAELVYWLPDGKPIAEEEADKIIADVLASDIPLDDFEEYPGLSIEINEDVGEAHLCGSRIDAAWEIIQIAEVIKRQDIKEDNNNE